MAMTAAQQKDAYQFFIIAFGAAPGTVYMDQLNDAYASGMTTKQIVNVYTTKPQFTALYPNFLTNAEFATSLVNNVVKSSASDAAKAEAVADIQGALASGMTRGDVIYQVFTNLSNLPTTDAKWGGTVALFNNQVAVAEYYTETLLGSATDIGTLHTVVSGVTATSNVSSSGAIAALLGGGTSFSLTTALDNVSGTSLGDLFSANVVQNSLGEQTNQLATGDKISGGAGIDSLIAVVQSASALNNVPSQAITPITSSVEKVSFTALTVNQGALNTAEAVVINAKSMTGLTTVSSLQSDASLTVQNLTTLTDTGVYADRRNTDSVTIRMDHSGNDRALDAQSNMTVLFDNDYLLANRSSTNVLELRAVNAFSLRESALPLVGFTDVSFTVGTTLVVVPVTDAMRALSGQPAYDAMAQGIRDKLTSLNITNVTVTVDPARTALFTDDVGSFAQGTIAGNYFPITVTASNQTLVRGAISTDNSTINANFLNTEILGGSTSANLITSNIQLEKVGRGAEGGSLVVGGMSTDLNNAWDYSAHALKEGVEQFKVTVSGDETQPSSLSNLSSTNNTLQTVTVDWATASLADLYIGNHNTVAPTVAGLNVLATAINGDRVDNFAQVTTLQNYALKDVRTFTANDNNSAVNPSTTLTNTNDVNLNAYLSNEVVAKYMTRVDIAAPATDNAAFAYNFGSGNDALNLNLSKANLAASGTATREDFSLAIATGGGNDTVTTQIGDGAGTYIDAWYSNNRIQSNLSIDTGTGNDTVTVRGAGTWTIATGAGNDAVYSDNSGRQIATVGTVAGEQTATWVFNSANQAQATGGVQTLGNLASAAAVTGINTANLNLTVSYRGITSTVTVGTTATNAGGTVNDLTVNQAIKNAVNNDPYLSKLLSAQDGTGRTLVVSALTDGVFNDADLSVSLTTTAVPTTLQTAAGAVNLSAANATSLGFTLAGLTATANVGGRFDSAIADADGVPGVQIVGFDSTQDNNNTINAGAGTDTVVLSTGQNNSLAFETVNVADTQADVVFNATHAVITADALDRVVTSSNVNITNAAGVVTVADLTVTGSAGNDIIVATNASFNVLLGGAGNDTITGGTSADTITGGAGADNLTGGAGADKFNISAGITEATADVITDFATTVDKIGFGGVAATFTNYSEGAAALADFAAALAAANVVMTNTGGASSQYSAQQVGLDTYVFFNDGAAAGADQVVKLTGVALNGIEFGDIIA